ncbi:MAG: response regulator [Kiritimatiellae bacterium]|nr:response regulator [Kiritimatiellia bacterium]
MILVVDDDEQLRELLEAALADCGYRVETAIDGADAYRHLKTEDCRCMLLDINMPRINGIELLLLMQSEGLDVPTILMADHGDFDDAELKQFESVCKFMPKPFSMVELMEAIQTHARKF